MPVIKRNDTNTLLAAIGKGQVSPVYLVVGDRFLCQTMVQDLLKALLPDPDRRLNNCIAIDGAQEDPESTLRHLRTYSLFPGRQVIKVADTLLLSSKNDAKTLWAKALKEHAAGDGKSAVRVLTKMFSLAEIKPADVLTISPEEWKKLFIFERPAGDLAWLREIISDPELLPERSTAGSKAADAADRFAEAFAKGIPANNILVLTAETVDRRKAFFKFICAGGTVIDLADLAGNTTAIKKEQDVVLRGLVLDTLKGFGKTMSENVVRSLLERVGFYPVAVVMETEKLALYVGEARAITAQDLDTMIGRTRETALYEFTETFAVRDLGTAILRLTRLREDGVHHLQVLAGLRNFIKKLLVIAAVQKRKNPVYAPQSYDGFQKNYLPALKASLEKWPKVLDGNPYALYMSFRQAEKFSILELQTALERLLQAEYQMKGSKLPEFLVIENFLLGLFVQPETKYQIERRTRRSTA
ncbi:MAG: hypothetical protein A2511_08705 [Deltaproteobacteria bacterium RIFOXYD12_FULL_50_9]|nr:MAG: hypothetical protein A2511_08705 [Deltaproteobacteria bacterium RIFOXYD12_FULL_50_9]